ncbi:cell division protein FtsI [Paenibacillus sp. LC231]|uniref:peptidoglycan D,D-transpeptidase FtsI family protein n=1 Tax=Paenibacillus sp. LC231 TaxID=1120679 RepID=UPI0008DD4976|nr:penicillin-binding transpeptidase domain-containing protein [Paenibacillus sp. LC231]OIB02496.1 cell division protein FtsI [Paenibacillus sp. LC231]
MKGFKPYKDVPDETEIRRRFHGRINIFFFSAFLIFCVIIVRMAILQFVEGPELASQETGGEQKHFPLQPIRGSIIDASGTKLAYSTASNSLYITLMKDYSKKTDKGKENRPEAEEMAKRLVQAFNKYGDPKAEPITVKKVIKDLDLEYIKHHGYEPRRIKTDLTKEEIAYFMENRAKFPGIQIVEENVRHYDPDTVAVQTIGYLKKFRGSKDLKVYEAIDQSNKDQKNPGLIYTEEEWIGYDGLEQMFQEELRGKSGYLNIPINPQNMVDGVPTMVAPEKGLDIHTTIHKDIQLATEQAIMDQLQYLHTHPVSGKLHKEALTGYAVAMEVDTGNVVAMASMPDYDSNVRVNGGKITPDIVDSSGNGTITIYGSGRSGNGFESTIYLGSVIKPLTVLIGLNEGLFGLNETYPDKGYALIGREGYEKSISNSGGHRNGPIKPQQAIQQSSNAFMIDMIGKRLVNKYGGEKGVTVWEKYMMQFGLGVTTGSGLPGEFKGRGEYTNTEAAGSNLAALAYASFGQMGKYTPLQLAQYTVMLANEGKRVKPQLVSKITDQEGKVVKEFGREVLNEVEFPKAYWQTIKRGMNTQGLAAFEDFKYDFARKTGTSEQEAKVNGTWRKIDNGVFIAFAPRDNPKLAVAVVVPEGGFGSQSAAPIARKIFDAYDEVYGLDGTPHPKKTEEQTKDGGEEETGDNR